MSSRFPVRTLLLPSAVAALLCLGLSALLSSGWSNWGENLLQGLAATFLGILIAATFVDQMQQSHEQKQWQGARRRVERKILRLAWVFLICVDNFAIINEAKLQGPREDAKAPKLWNALEREKVLARLLDSKESLEFSHFFYTDALLLLPEKVEAVLDTYGRFLDHEDFDDLMSLMEGVEELLPLQQVDDSFLMQMFEETYRKALRDSFNAADRLFRRYSGRLIV